MIKPVRDVNNPYAAHYETMRDAGGVHRRAEAYRAYSKRGLPNRRVETWHYTDLKAALATPAPLAAPRQSSGEIARTRDSFRFVTLDGAFRPDLSDLADLPAGLRVQSLREALENNDPDIMSALWPNDSIADDAAIALNGALMQDGVVVSVACGVTLSRPVEFVALVSGGEPQSIFTRSALILGSGARLRLIETPGALASDSSSATQLNHLLTLRLERDASVDMLTHIAGSNDDSVSVFSLVTHLSAGARLNAHLLMEGGGLLRRQIFATLDGEDSQAAFNGVTLARGRQHADTTLIVDHRQPRGSSRERFRTILDERAVGVFQGKIIVRPGAQKTDGVMQSKAILVSDGATMNNKPELEIFADDVKCGHGAACGQLDEDQLFYLMARGLPRSEAESLLLEAFASEAFMDIADESLSEFAIARIIAWLAKRSRS